MTAYARTLTRILVVEDEPKLRHSIAEGLSLEDFLVTSAASAGEALLHLESRTFDTVVLDLMLPDYDGLELVRRIRARGDATPVLVISARAGLTLKTEVYEAGANDFLAKPFSFDELLQHAKALAKG